MRMQDAEALQVGANGMSRKQPGYVPACVRSARRYPYAPRLPVCIEIEIYTLSELSVSKSHVEVPGRTTAAFAASKLKHLVYRRDAETAVNPVRQLGKALSAAACWGWKSQIHGENYGRAACWHRPCGSKEGKWRPHYMVLALAFMHAGLRNLEASSQSRRLRKLSISGWC